MRQLCLLIALGAAQTQLGCTSERADVQTLCDAPKASGSERRPLSSDEERLAYFFEWTSHNVWTLEGRRLLAKVEGERAAWGEMRSTLLEAAQQNEVRKCALAAWLLAHDAKGTPSTKASP